MKKVVAVAAVAAVAVIPAAVALSAQARDGESAISREIVTELRALRTVIERAADTQVQTHAITGLMDVQQRRLAEANTRLDIVRRELDGVALRHQDLSRQLASVEQMTPQDMRGPGGTPPIDARQALEDHRSQVRHQHESVSAQMQQLRARESEALNQLGAEEARWNELAARLDQWLRR